MNLNSIFNKPKQKKDEELFKWKKLPYKKDDVRTLNNLLKEARNGNKSNKQPSATLRSFIKGGFRNSPLAGQKKIDKSQRVTFKMTYGKNTHTHSVYLNHYMPQHNKDYVEEKPEIFGTPRDEYDEAMSDLHFKCIISPESQDVDLEVLSKEFIKRVEAITGYKLLWQTAIHTDTEHRHAHIAINGVDADGNKIRFPKEMIKKSMREILQYVATQMVGERTQEQMNEAKRHATQTNRWTKIDDEIEMLGTVFPERFANDLQKERLAHLRKIGLAKLKGGNYVINEDWKETLVATGRYNTYLEEYLKNTDMPLSLYKGGGITGKVDRVISFDKDESWNDALVINTGKERVYVPIWQLHKDVRNGDVVEIKAGTEKLSRQIVDKDIHVKKKNNQER